MGTLTNLCPKLITMSTDASGPIKGKEASKQSVSTLGFAHGQIVQEYYLDDDCDEALRSAIESDTGNALVDEEYGDVADGAIVWWRDDDGEVEDLTDLLVDALTNLDDDGGLIWVFTPKTGTDGAVEPQEIEEAAKTAGLHATSTKMVSPQWLGIRLTARGRVR